MVYQNVMGHSAARVLLGIDLGTTKVAAAVVDAETRSVLVTSSRPHESDERGLPPGRSEQRVPALRAALDACIADLPENTRRTVTGIGLTGQMHGVALWNPGGENFSNLITWQDQRCLEDDFLESLRTRSGEDALQTGYGGASLAWLAQNAPSIISKYSHAGTIHDLVAALITGSNVVKTDPSDAASWGFFDLAQGVWKEHSAQKVGIPRSWLPEIHPAGARLGTLTAQYAQRWNVPEGIPVGVPLGDNQASLFGSLRDPGRQIALTIGTGAQLSVVVPRLPDVLPKANDRFEFRPYVGDSFIAVAASLTGGRVLAAFGRALHDFMSQLNLPAMPSQQEIQIAMHEQGLRGIDTAVQANPSFSGERHDTSCRGSFSNLSFDNFSVGDLTAALCRGLVEGLRDSLPAYYREGRTEVVGSGNAIHRSLLMQQTIERAFHCKLILAQGAETTASGAALVAATRL